MEGIVELIFSSIAWEKAWRKCEFKIKIALAHPAASNGVCPRQRCQLLLFT
jgi:hypothetical protein